MRARCLSWILVGLSLSGCAETLGFRPDGFLAEDSAYSLDYLDASAKRLLPREWTIDNFFVTESGRPTYQKDQGVYRRKIEWVLDDGTTQETSLIVHDLKFLHSSGAVLSVRRVPVPYQMQKMKLSTVAEDWANNNNGTALDFSFEGIVAKRVASKLIESKERKVDGRPAREVTFEIVDLDQLQFNPQAPRTRVRGLFIHARMTKRFNNFSHPVPAVLLVAYAHDAEKFDKLVPDYESLVARIHPQR